LLFFIVNIIFLISFSRDALVCEDFGESVPVSQLVEVAPNGIDLDTFITIVLPILEGLHFAHSRDVLHGDGVHLIRLD
jgi:hypothetical protein